jgi:hypothetical protein
MRTSVENELYLNTKCFPVSIADAKAGTQDFLLEFIGSPGRQLLSAGCAG